MNKGLQVLLAVTCVAVLGAIGYWAYSNHQAQQQAEARAAVVAQQALRNHCLDSVERWVDTRYSGSPDQEAYATSFACRDNGTITEDELMTRLRSQP